VQLRTLGNVLSFVETRFAEGELHTRIVSALSGVRNIDVQPINLRSIFTTLARDAQSKMA
jgi:hypothetical protein